MSGLLSGTGTNNIVFNVGSGSSVGQKSVLGATSAAAKMIGPVAAGATIAAILRSAGTATVYVSTSDYADCVADVAAHDFSGVVGTGQANWRTIPELTAITADGDQAQPSAVTAVAIVPSSGTWDLEVAQ